MSRRHRWNPQARGGVAGERSSLGDTHVAKAINTIEHWASATAAMSVQFNYSRDQILPWLFADDTLARLSAVKGLVTPNNTNGSYRLKDHVGLTIDFEDAPVPTPTTAAFKVQRDRAGPLLEAVSAIQSIYEQYEVVKHVLRWLNANATPGAIRHYFPGAMLLCPDSPGLAELIHTPLRYSTPEGIAAQLPLIREAATTVARSTLMPSDKKGNVYDRQKGWWITFPSYEFQPLEGSASVKTDQQVFFS